MTEMSASRTPSYLTIGIWLLALVSITCSLAGALPFQAKVVGHLGRLGAGTECLLFAIGLILKVSFGHSDRVREWFWLPRSGLFPPVTAFYWAWAAADFPGFGWHPWGLLWTGILVSIGWDARNGPTEGDTQEEYRSWQRNSEIIRLGLS